MAGDPGASEALVNPGRGEASTDPETGEALIGRSNTGTAEALTRTPDADGEITSAGIPM